jgi:hypothetical protein
LIEFEGTAEDMIFKRLRTRLTHLSLRIRRMRLQQDAEYRNEAYATCLLLEADLHEKAAVASPVSVEAPPVVATTPIYVHPHARCPEPEIRANSHLGRIFQRGRERNDGQPILGTGRGTVGSSKRNQQGPFQRGYRSVQRQGANLVSFRSQQIERLGRGSSSVERGISSARF